MTWKISDSSWTFKEKCIWNFNNSTWNFCIKYHARLLVESIFKQSYGKWNWNARNVKHCLTTNCVELRFLCNTESEIIWIVDWTRSCLAFGMRHNNIFTLVSQKRNEKKKWCTYIVVDRDKRKESESPYLIRNLIENRYNSMVSWKTWIGDQGSRIEPWSVNGFIYFSFFF